MQFVKQFLGDRNGNGQVEKNGSTRLDPLFKRNPNPYLAARRQWNSQIDRAFNFGHVRLLIDVACLLIALASVAGLTYLGGKSKYVPLVIEVDKLGDRVAVGPAQVAGPADPRVIRASLAAFIASARLVTPDQELERRAIFSVYALMKTKDPSTVKMNEYLNGPPDTTPFARASRMTVNADVLTVLPITDSGAWQVDWEEVVRDRDGGLIQKVQMRATLQIYLDPPGAEAKQTDIERNPLGIFIRDFNWQSR
jgi:type IV secretory pathway TrbF-like protein